LKPINPDTVLVVVSDRVGDAVFCTPAVRLLRQMQPGATVEVLALSPAAGEVFQHNPVVATVLVEAREKLSPATLPRPYDLVLDFADNRHTRQLFARAGRPSLAFAWPEQGHVVDAALEFVARGLRKPLARARPDSYELYPQPEHTTRVAALLGQAGLAGERDCLIGLQVGCNRIARSANAWWKFWKKKRQGKAWPVIRFYELAAALLARRPSLGFVLTGVAAERDLAESVVKALPAGCCANLAGQTSILELAALCGRLRAFVTADTGPLHIACAMRTPLVALYGPTSAQTTGPWPVSPDRLVLSAPDLAELPTARVLDAIERLLAM
jgi:ADP-heptose:LPS heptosyltransferase